MALIRLCVGAGLSEPLLFAHTTVLEISCRGSNSVNPDSSDIVLPSIDFVTVA